MKTKFFAVLILLVLALLVSACASQPVNLDAPIVPSVQPTQAPAQAAAAVVPTAAPTNAPVAAPAEAQAPAPAAAAPVASATDAPQFTYISGGTGFALGTMPITNTTAIGTLKAQSAADDGWFRVTQATNGEFLPWTFLMKVVTSTAPVSDTMQWDSATQLTISGPVTVTFQVKRDLASSQSIKPDPYVAANAKGSKLGLGWFFRGEGAVAVDGKAVDVGKGKVKVAQLGFPSDSDHVYVITVQVDKGETLFMNQGEKLTDKDNF